MRIFGNNCGKGLRRVSLFRVRTARGTLRNKTERIPHITPGKEKAKFTLVGEKIKQKPAARW